METTQIIKEKVTINIMVEDDPESPRDWDNLGTMVCWHRRYILGDKHEFGTPEDFHDWLKDNPGTVYLPLYLYDHSGISMSTRSFVGRAHHAEWDSGQVGYIYIERDKILKEYGWKRLTAARIERIKSYLAIEVEYYDDFLTGRVYGYNVTCNRCGELLDSCWGYFGSDHQASGLLESAERVDTCESCESISERLELVTA